MTKINPKHFQNMDRINIFEIPPGEFRFTTGEPPMVRFNNRWIPITLSEVTVNHG